MISQFSGKEDKIWQLDRLCYWKVLLYYQNSEINQKLGRSYQTECLPSAVCCLAVCEM